MGIEDLIRDAKERDPNTDDFRRSYDSLFKEVEMWRNRYMESFKSKENTEKGRFVCTVFFYTPSTEMVRWGPETIIEDAIKGYENR